MEERDLMADIDAMLRFLNDCERSGYRIPPPKLYELSLLLECARDRITHLVTKNSILEVNQRGRENRL